MGMLQVEQEMQTMHEPVVVVETRPDPEVLAKPQRRQFSASYKLEMLEKADQCTN
ncbi:MAG: hypothetical protein HQL73_06160, partial [Magnetococcales bacterium]|nr:hypothetical protein [Magnetococcales bacterium]